MNSCSTARWPWGDWARCGLMLWLTVGMGGRLPAVAAETTSVGGAGRARVPDIVLILADDLGWSDLGCYGGDLVETPHLDRLAREGVRFTSAYAMPVCSPSRAMLMTGRHAARLRMTIWSEGSRSGPTNRVLLQGESRHDLPLTEVTVAERLQAVGYRTALVGKWHLGDAAHFPETQGFDINVGGTHWGAPPTYFWPYRGTGGGRFGSEFRYVPGLGVGREGEYLTDRLTDEAIAILRRERKRPLFLFLSHHAPHSPFEAKPGEVERFRDRLRPGMRHRNPTYAAMVKSLDDSVGRMLKELKRTGRDRRTLVVFASDNGGFLGVDRAARPPGTSGPSTWDDGRGHDRNHPFRAGKGWLYEGGIRVPLMVWWPGVTPRGGGECDEPVQIGDLVPTLLRAAGVPEPESESGVGESDTRDLGPLLRTPSGSLDREALYFHYPHYYDASTPVSAVRAGPWKLLEFLEDGRVELYRLDDDPGETRDRSVEEPVRVGELLGRLQTWRTHVGAAMPTANPGYVGGSDGVGRAEPRR